MCGETGFIDDETTIGSGGNLSLFETPYYTTKEGTPFFYYYINYKKQDVYRLELEMPSYDVKDVAFIYHPQGLEGEKRTYKGEQWTVLYDKGDRLELLSPNIIGELSLGKDDDTNQSLQDYNNAIQLLNKYCRDTLKDETARSIGSNPNNPDNDNPGMLTEEDLPALSVGDYNGKGKKTDDNAEQDFVRMIYYDVSDVVSDGAKNPYWLASRLWWEVPHGTEFQIRENNSLSYGEKIWTVSTDGTQVVRS